jgi:hypothetical protein
MTVAFSSQGCPKHKASEHMHTHSISHLTWYFVGASYFRGTHISWITGKEVIWQISNTMKQEKRLSDFPITLPRTPNSILRQTLWCDAHDLSLIQIISTTHKEGIFFL